MSLTTIRVSEADFNPGEEIERLIESSPEAGGVASFVGVVRNRNDGNDVTHLTLEHYPAMTERALAGIVERARARWDVCGVTVIHRVGEMAVGEHIVLVVVTSAHRREAFEACEFIMDWLKTEAPFWKKERTPEGERWLWSATEARENRRSVGWSRDDPTESSSTPTRRSNAARGSPSAPSSTRTANPRSGIWRRP